MFSLTRLPLRLRAAASSVRLPARRHLSVTRFRLAQQPSDANSSLASEFAATFAQSPLYNVIKAHPSAIEAIKEVGDLMQKKGIDVTQPPSKMTMLKLAMDGDFREAIGKVMSELKAAGVDVTPEVSPQHPFTSSYLARRY
ncbi:hypothetical protein QFC19_006316 [Naganishia cerealis]|uniref:Uncharacterized protein n=1 Tax=Naganishia cerealis TaxID=610337 RepID=A0ACC2VHD6_9TREE|nr:hypothetical protein QFC19_006316 [Naganishia cerealis]